LSEHAAPAACPDDRSLTALMGTVVAAGTEQRCARLTLSEDPFYRRLAPGRESEAVGFGLAVGQAAAAMTMETWGREPEDIAAALQVPVARSEALAQTGRAVLFSEYGDRPPSITLHMQSIQEANRLIREHDLAGMLGLSDVAPVHLAHELFHHLESQRLTPGTAGFRIQTGRLGPLRFRTGLPSLSEIAADHFAVALLDLSVPPKAIEFVTVYSLNPVYAWELLARLQALPA
jgi:hypothetical protein